MNCNLQNVKSEFKQKKSNLKHDMSMKQSAIKNFFRTTSTPQLSELNDVTLYDFIFLYFKEDRKMLFDILKVFRSLLVLT